MPNAKEQTPEEQRRQFHEEANSRASDKGHVQTEIDLRHYAPIQSALSYEANGYEWKRETGDIQSYQHKATGGWLHLDPQGGFYNRQGLSIAREQALEDAGHGHGMIAQGNAPVRSLIRSSVDERGLGV